MSGVPMTLHKGETKSCPIPVSGKDLTTGAPRDLTTATGLQVGFNPNDGSDDPAAPTQWYAASLVINPTRELFWLAVLLGPLGVYDIAKGQWIPWVKFTLGSEQIIEPSEDNDLLAVV